MSGAVLTLPIARLWHVRRQLYLYLLGTKAHSKQRVDYEFSILVSLLLNFKYRSGGG